MNLAELQRDFTAFLRSDGSEQLPAVAERSRRGLRVYYYAFRASLIDALRDVFERTHAWLGDERFDDAACAHIAAHPPHSWTLADFGLGFDATLDGLYPENPEVAELAWLDWSLRVAFNGPDAGALDMAPLVDVDWDNAPLRLVPTLATREVRTNVAALWGGLNEEGDTPPAAELLDEEVILTVWRHDLMPRFHTVSPDEARALALAASGASFGEICTALAADGGDGDQLAMRAGAMLGRWIEEGVLAGVG
jgi:hypothetical protein